MRPSCSSRATRRRTVLGFMPMHCAIVPLAGCGLLSLNHQCRASWRRMFTSRGSRPRACCFSRMIEGSAVQPASISVRDHFSSFRRSSVCCWVFATAMLLTVTAITQSNQSSARERSASHPSAAWPRGPGQLGRPPPGGGAPLITNLINQHYSPTRTCPVTHVKSITARRLSCPGGLHRLHSSSGRRRT